MDPSRPTAFARHWRPRSDLALARWEVSVEALHRRAVEAVALAEPGPEAARAPLRRMLEESAALTDGLSRATRCTVFSPYTNERGLAAMLRGLASDGRAGARTGAVIGVGGGTLDALVALDVGGGVVVDAEPRLTDSVVALAVVAVVAELRAGESGGARTRAALARALLTDESELLREGARLGLSALELTRYASALPALAGSSRRHRGPARARSDASRGWRS